MQRRENNVQSFEKLRQVSKSPEYLYLFLARTSLAFLVHLNNAFWDHVIIQVRRNLDQAKTILEALIKVLFMTVLRVLYDLYVTSFHILTKGSLSPKSLIRYLPCLIERRKEERCHGRRGQPSENPTPIQGNNY